MWEIGFSIGLRLQSSLKEHMMTKYIVFAIIAGICLMYPSKIKGFLSYGLDWFLKLIKVR